MSDKDSVFDRIVDDDTRRSFMKKGAVATAGVAATSGFASAQDGDDVDVGGDLDDNWKALIFVDNFHPNARFAIVSDVTEWTPNYGDVQDSWFSDYNTRMIRWLNTDEVVPLFVAHEANVGEYDSDLGFITDVDDDQSQPQLYEMNREWTPFGDNERLITVNVSPVGEDTEDGLLEDDDWWEDTTNGDVNGNVTANGNATGDGVTDGNLTDGA